MSIINNIESNFPVDQWIIDAVHVWPLIRADLVSQLDSFLNKGSAVESKRGAADLQHIGRIRTMISSFSRCCHNSIADYKNNDKIANSNIDALFITNSINRSFVSGSYYNRIIDPIIDRLDDKNLRSLILEITWAGNYYTPRYRPSRYIQPYLDYLLVKSKLPLPRKFPGDSYLKRFDDFIQHLKSLNLSLVPPSIKAIQKEVALIRDISFYLKKIIIRTKPEIALSTQYYGRAGMALNLACRETGIPSVDIQHGLQGDLHWAYGRWARVPEKGYELLPSFFWCWSHDEAEVINKWNRETKKYHAPVVVGNLWLKKWIEGGSEIGSVYDQRINHLKEHHGKSIHILYTMQDETIPENIINSIKETASMCFWWIRCHPSQLDKHPEIYQFLSDLGLCNIDVENASTLPLFSILSNIDIHVTGWSTTVLEALAFGVPSILTHDFGAEYYEEQIRDGIAKCAYSSESIVTAVKSMVKNREKNQKSYRRPVSTRDSQFPIHLFTRRSQVSR